MLRVLLPPLLLHVFVQPAALAARGGAVGNLAYHHPFSEEQVKVVFMNNTSFGPIRLNYQALGVCPQLENQ